MSQVVNEPLRKRLARISWLFPFLRMLDESALNRFISDTRIWGLVAPGFNLTWKTDRKRVLDLIQSLRPVEGGKPLIRIGGNGDGGYLVPDDLEGIEYCFSPGVNVTSNFENELADRGIHSFLADYSVEAPPILRPEFTFDKKFLGATNNDKYFTLQSWKDHYLKDYKKDLILQMDIEGSEYPVILSTPDELLKQFRIVIVEFHALHMFFDQMNFDLYAACFEKLLQFFHVVHIHPNNFYRSTKSYGVEIPRIMEFTFLNKNRVDSVKPARQFPHPLDVINVSYRKDIVLPKCWYESE